MKTITHKNPNELKDSAGTISTATRLFLYFSVGLFVSFSSLSTLAEQIVWSQDFEGPTPDWSIEGGTWETGIPLSGPNEARSGRRLAATVLAGDYAPGANSRLISPSFSVPSADLNPRLRFWHWFSFGFADDGRIQAREVGNDEWTSISNLFTGTNSGIWTRPSFDLTEFAGKSIEIAFYFSEASSRQGAGWYVDDIEVITEPHLFNNPEGFESGLKGWWADNGTWEVGEPTSGPNSAYSGSHVAATVLAGDYAPGANSRLISPSFSVPSADLNPRLRFWHWFSFGFADDGRIQAREVGNDEWTSISNLFTGTNSGIWTRPSFDLTEFAGKSIEIAFYFSEASSRQGAGWYVDDIEIGTTLDSGYQTFYFITERNSLQISPTTKREDISFVLRDQPPNGASFLENGDFIWTPTEEQGPGLYDLEIWAISPGNSLTPINSTLVSIEVMESNTQPALDALPIAQRSSVNESNSSELLPNRIEFSASASDPDNNDVAYRWRIVEGKFSDLDLSPWTAYSRASNRNWEAAQFGERSFAQILGFGGNAASDDWLISPRLDFTKTSDESLIFESAKDFDGSDIEVMVSTNYSGSGDPATANWTSLTAILSSGNEQWVSSGDISLEQVTNSSNVHIAFHYTSSGTAAGQAALWEVGEIKILGTFPALEQALSFSLMPGAPANASIDQLTGAFLWEPTEADGPGEYEIGIVVTDDGAPTGPDAALSSEPSMFTIVVNEVNEPPVLSPIADLEVNENTGFGFTPQFADPDVPSNQFTWSLNETAASLGAAIDSSTGLFSWTPREDQGPGNYTMTVTITDDGTPPLSDTETFVVTVLDVNDPPVFEGNFENQNILENEPLSFTVAATDQDTPSQTLTYSLGDNSPEGTSINSSTGTVTWTPSEVQGPGSYTLSIIATDNGVNPPTLSAITSVQVSVAEANSAPLISAIEDLAVEEGAPLPSTHASASDPDLPVQQLFFDLDDSSKALGLTIDPESGLISWAPTEADGPGVYAVTVTVSDGSGTNNATAQTTFSITVDEINQAPTVTPIILPASIVEALPWSFQVVASDTDSPTVQTLTYSLSETAPLGALIDSIGNFSWTPTEDLGGQEQPVEFEILISDDGAPVQTTRIPVSIMVTEANTSPTLSLLPDISIPEGEAWEIEATATDTDIPLNTLEFSLGANAPQGMDLSPEGVLTWVPSELQGPGIFEISVSVDDGTGSDNSSSTSTFSVTVEDVNQPPVWTQPQPQSLLPGTRLEIQLNASDSDIPQNNLTYSLGTPAPDGLSLDIETGLLVWSPTVDQAGKHEITIFVNDQNTPEADLPRTTLSITVLDQNPTIARVEDQVVNELETISLSINASDPNQASDTLSYALNADAPDGSSISAEGLFEWTPAESQGPGEFPLTVSVIDDDGNKAEEAFVVSVIEVNQAAELVRIGNQQAEVGSTLTFVVTAFDADLIAGEPNDLLFSLGENTPDGVSLSENGEFSWTPKDSGVFELSICVIDDGEPALEDCETFIVSVGAEFKNLDFEQADLANASFFQSPSEEALPSWLSNHPQQGIIAYDVRCPSELCVSIHDSNSLTESVPANTHSILLQAGDPDGTGPQPSIAAQIKQLGMVPEDSKSMQLAVGPGYRNLTVSMGDSQLLLSESETSNESILLVADISAFSGKMVELTIEAGITGDDLGTVLLHSISFSEANPDSVPIEFSIAAVNSGDLFRVTLDAGEVDKSYALQATEAIGISSQWITLESQVYKGQQLEFLDEETGKHTQRFYRVIEVQDE